MKTLDVVQGSEDWKLARLALPTASCFDKICTPKTRKASASQDKYLARLCAEWCLGEPLDDYVSPYMERGTEMEAQAVAWYEFDAGAETRAVGLCLRDDEKAGASPDRLVGDKGGLEIKCPSAEVHMAYFLDSGRLVDEYYSQVQGECYIAELEWVDLLSFHPTLPSVVVRVPRDPAYIGALDTCLAEFIAKLDAAKAKLEPHRIVRTRRVVHRDPDPFATEPNTEDNAWTGTK